MSTKDSEIASTSTTIRRMAGVLKEGYNSSIARVWVAKEVGADERRYLFDIAAEELQLHTLYLAHHPRVTDLARDKALLEFNCDEVEENPWRAAAARIATAVVRQITEKAEIKLLSDWRMLKQIAEEITSKYVIPEIKAQCDIDPKFYSKSLLRELK